MVRPVNYRDARRFQLITVLIAALPLAALAALPLPDGMFNAMGNMLSGWPVVTPPGWGVDLGLPLIAGVGVHALPVAVVLYLLAMTGVASFFFHPPHLTVVQQNRAIALSYYACAPLVLLVLPTMAAAIFLALNVYHEDWADRQFMIMAFLGLFMSLSPVVVLLMLLIASLRMLRHATVCSTARMIAMGVTLPIAWAVLAALILVGIPWLVGFGMLVWWSFE